jgi:hypothetical protein
MSATVTIFVNAPGSDTPFEKDLVNIARQVSGVSMDRIRFELGTESVFPGRPSLTLSDGETRNIHYLAAPQGRELAPFLDALSWLGKGKESPVSPGSRSLDTLTFPVHVLVAIAPSCPYCPDVVRSAISLAVGRPLVTVSIVDALEFQELAEPHRVNATPTIVINDGLTLVGKVNAEELAGRLLEVGRAESLTSLLDSMIKLGRVEDAAELLCRENQPGAVIPLYLSKELSTRMGALVVMEEAIARSPRVFDPILGQLTDLLFQDEVALRGDTAELLGKIGNPSAIPALRKAAADEDPEVREAALEALALLEE